MLVVGDSLPASVRDYLIATPTEDAAGNKLHMEIVAIGGPAAVTPSAMNSARAAAASAPALTVNIVSPVDWDNDGLMDDQPRAGETSFELRFSDDIAGSATATDPATTQLRARLLDVLRIGGVPAVLVAQSADPPGVAFGGSTTDCAPDTVTVNLDSPLVAGQQIVLNATELEFGAQSDQRPLTRAQTSVIRKETRGPTFEIIPIIGQSTITVIAKDAIADAAGNKNADSLSPAPITPTSLPTVSVAVSSHVHDVQAKYAVPNELTSGNELEGGAEDVFFTAKPNGRAAGANGNGWTFDFRQASTYSADGPISIEVLVNTRGKRAFITFVGGKPKFSDLAAALRAHSGFNSLWDVSVDNVDGECASADKALTVAEIVTDTGCCRPSGHRWGACQRADPHRPLCGFH